MAAQREGPVSLQWITIGWVWTGEFDLNTLRVDGKIFESGKKKLRIQKYPDTYGRGLNTESKNKLLKNCRPADQIWLNSGQLWRSGEETLEL